MDFFVPRSHCCGNLTVQVDFLSVMCVWEGPEREKELDPISIIEQVCFECWMESTQQNHPLHMWVADIYNNISIFECRDRERESTETPITSPDQTSGTNPGICAAYLIT